MKYMTFHSSCAFAGVANMLERHGVDVQDRTIALGMKLPYLFAKEGGKYLAGPMLQTAQWFGLYLHPMGFTMDETAVQRGDVPAVLAPLECAMLGLRVTPESKHAVIYAGKDEDRFCFINNKWERTDEPERLALTEAELLARLDETAVLAMLRAISPVKVDFAPYLQRSCDVLSDLKQDICTFCSTEQSPEAIRAAMDTYFRAILLDGITMLDLCGQSALADQLRTVQREFLTIVRSGKAATLCRELSLPLLTQAMDEYIALIRREMEML